MNRLIRIAAAGLAAAVGFASPVFPAGEYKKPEEHTWAFEGPFGSYDRSAMQRGFQVYQQICAACHSLDYIDFRHLGQRGGPFEYVPAGPGGELVTFDNPNDNPVIRQIASEYTITDLDDFGLPIERPGRPSDSFPDPYENQQMARMANGGAYPVDLSVITKARKGGPEYIRSLLLGYEYDVPEDVDVRPGLYYNPYFPGGLIAMPPQLREGMVEYADGTASTPEQMAHDVVSFLSWAAEPHMEARKRLGLMVMIYLTIFAILLWLAYRQVWSNVKH